MRKYSNNKIKRLTRVIKDLTVLLKSFKGLLEVVFYVFLMCYIGYDKIRFYSVIRMRDEMKDVSMDNMDGMVDSSNGVVVEQLDDSSRWDIDYMGMCIIIILFTVVVYRIIGMIRVIRKVDAGKKG